jgi:hypothetical protein
MKPFLSWVPNHAAERSVVFFFVSDMPSPRCFRHGRLVTPSHVVLFSNEASLKADQITFQSNISQY